MPEPRRIKALNIGTQFGSWVTDFSHQYPPHCGILALKQRVGVLSGLIFFNHLFHFQDLKISKES